MPLGWYFGPQWERWHGVSWPERLCDRWIKNDRYLKNFAAEIFQCPCTLEHALVDRGRFLPDTDCDRDANPQCLYNKGAVHCVTTGAPSMEGSEQQCCYDKNNYLMLSYDQQWGSRPRRSHNLGFLPWTEANKASAPPAIVVPVRSRSARLRRTRFCERAGGISRERANISAAVHALRINGRKRTNSFRPRPTNILRPAVRPSVYLVHKTGGRSTKITIFKITNFEFYRVRRPTDRLAKWRSPKGRAVKTFTWANAIYSTYLPAYRCPHCPSGSTTLARSSRVVCGKRNKQSAAKRTVSNGARPKIASRTNRRTWVRIVSLATYTRRLLGTLFRCPIY